jgi:hypothetical protein
VLPSFVSCVDYLGTKTFCVTDNNVMLTVFDLQFSCLILYPHSSEPGVTVADIRDTLLLVYRGTPGESHWFREN